MGWFGLTSDKRNPADPEPSNDGGYIAPDRSARAQCYEMRDKFFECLDRHDILDSVKQDKKAQEHCSPELKQFEKSCASSWVTYFKKRRVYEYQKEQTLKKLEAEGAQGLPGSSGTGGNMAAAALRGNK